MIDPHTLTVLEFPALRDILAAYTASSLGRQEALALQPYTDYTVITRLLLETTEAKQLYDAHQAPPLGSIADIRALMDGIADRRAPLEPEDLNRTADTLEAVKRLKVFLHKQREHVPSLWEFICNCPDFNDIPGEIRRCIDEESHVRDNASSQLHSLRRQLKRLDSQIHSRMMSLMNSRDLDQALENRNLLTRSGRPVLAVKSGFRKLVPGILHDKSNTGVTVFIEPHAVAELVNELEDTRFEERREVSRILWELTKAIQERSEDILVSADILAHIDITCAKARFSTDFNMIPPELTENGSVNLKDARHPLLIHYEQQKHRAARPVEVFNRVVPLNVRFGDDYILLIITGPNTGGKTVALKTIGLLAMMAQSGMHIPAGWTSTLPVFRQIYSDIGDEQSIEQSLSTFSSHMTHIVRILTSADKNTLVLLDELGSGTDPAEGAALGTAILEHLRRARACAVVTTHLGDLKTYAFSTPMAENASMEFNRETFTPTYRLLTGQPGSSNALAIARRLGMPESVLEETEKTLARTQDSTADLINRVQETRVAAEERRQHAEELRDRLKKHIEQAERDKQKALDEAHGIIELTVRDIQNVVDDYARTAANAPKPWGDLARELSRRIQSLAAGTPLSELQRRFIDNVKEGDTVFITSFQANGIIRKIRRKQSQMRVEIDGLLFDIPISQISEKPFALKDTRVKPDQKKIKKEERTDKPEKPYEKLMPAKQRKFIESLKKGDKAYAPVLNSAVSISKINHEKQMATVHAGMLEVELPLNRLYPCRPPKKKS
jgi:DNA mismatch repair protein MutS2